MMRLHVRDCAGRAETWPSASAPDRFPVRRTSVAVAVAVVAVAVSACEGVGGCFQDADNTWRNANLDAIREEPRQCPYVVYGTFSPVPVTLMITAPSTSYLEYSVDVDVVNYARQRIIIGASGPITSPYVSDPFCQTRGAPVCSGFRRNVYGATTTPIRDSANVLSGVPGLGYRARAWLVLGGSIAPPTTSVVSGPSTVRAVDYSRWTAVTRAADTNSFMYQWHVNGQPITGATKRSFYRQFGHVGQYMLRLVATRSDYVADTVNFAVDVPYRAYLEGPADVFEGTMNRWSILDPGGDPPYSYVWKWNGQVMSHQSYMDAYAGASGSTNQVDVTVSDASGRVASASKLVYVVYGDPDGNACDAPPCPGG